VCSVVERLALMKKEIKILINKDEETMTYVEYVETATLIRKIRNLTMVKMRADGHTLKAVGKAFDTTPERVKDITSRTIRWEKLIVNI